MCDIFRHLFNHHQSKVVKIIYIYIYIYIYTHTHTHKTYIYIYIYIQGVPGRMCQTSG